MFVGWKKFQIKFILDDALKWRKCLTKCKKSEIRL